MLPHPLTNFVTQKYQNEPKFNGVYSRANLSFVPTLAAQIKDGSYMINLDEYKSIITHWIAFYMNGNNGKRFW